MIPGSAHVSCVGEDVSSSRTFVKIVSARRRNQHTRGVRYPGVCLILLSLNFALTGFASAAEVIPPKPDRYFNDYAHVVSPQTASRLNEQLAQFERDSSDQVVVAVFPKMQSDSDIADYAQRVAQSWGVGSKENRNGVVLLVFVQDRKISIQVGYGLEGALPDITAYDIRANRIAPRFRTGDYEGGLAEGIDSIIKAIRGEYKGTGRTVKERRSQQNGGALAPFIFFFVFVIILIIVGRMNRRRGGYRYSGLGGPYIGGWSGGSGGWSSGGWSSGGGGGGFSGFSGGGGSFGGGGSSGSWWFVRTKEFVSKLDHDRIVHAIREAEAKTSGEIRVYVQRGELKKDVLAVAEERFQKMGMHKTSARNGVLIFVAPRMHQFAVIGDEAIHKHCGNELWERVVAKMREHFRSERFSDAIVDAIKDIGQVLARHFPGKSGDQNELPNTVTEGWHRWIGRSAGDAKSVAAEPLNNELRRIRSSWLTSPGGAADPPTPLHSPKSALNSTLRSEFFNRAVGPWVSIAGCEAPLARGNPSQAQDGVVDYWSDGVMMDPVSL